MSVIKKLLLVLIILINIINPAYAVVGTLALGAAAKQENNYKECKRVGRCHSFSLKNLWKNSKYNADDQMNWLKPPNEKHILVRQVTLLEGIHLVKRFFTTNNANNFNSINNIKNNNSWGNNLQRDDISPRKDFRDSILINPQQIPKHLDNGITSYPNTAPNVPNQYIYNPTHENITPISTPITQDANMQTQVMANPYLNQISFDDNKIDNNTLYQIDRLILGRKTHDTGGNILELILCGSPYKWQLTIEFYQSWGVELKDLELPRVIV